MLDSPSPETVSASIEAEQASRRSKGLYGPLVCFVVILVAVKKDGVGVKGPQPDTSVASPRRPIVATVKDDKIVGIFFLPT